MPTPGDAPPDWTLRPFGDCAVRVVQRVDPGERPDEPSLGLEHIGVETLYTVGRGRAADVTGDLLSAHPGDVIFGRLRPYFRIARAQAPAVG